MKAAVFSSLALIGCGLPSGASFDTGIGEVTLPVEAGEWALEFQSDGAACLEVRVDGELRNLAPQAGFEVITATSPVEVSVGTVDCADAAPLPSGEITVQTWPVGEDPLDTLQVRLVTDPEQDGVATDTVEAAITGAFAGTSLNIKLSHEKATLEGANFGRFELDELRAVASAVAPARPGEIRVLMGGCLLHRSPVTGELPVQAFVPRVPAGFRSEDAIFVGGRDCRSGQTQARPPESLGKLIAHELGHFLGLEHLREDNLMHPTPLRTHAEGLTEVQSARLISVARARASRPH